VARAARLVVALLFVSACRTLPPAIPLAPDDPRPEAGLAQWAEAARDRHSLRGRARLAVDGDDGEVRIRGKEIVVLERPARMRVEVLGFLKQTAAVIATDGERFEIFRSADRSYETGEVHAQLLWREAHLALTPEEAVEVLLGVPALGAGLVPARAVDAGEGWIRMDLVDAERRVRQRVAFDAASRLREFEVVGDDGAALWRAEFGDYASIDGVPFAHAIVLDVTAGAAHVEISLRDVELNPELPPDIFRLRAPAEAGALEREGG
jgi:outer membrane lipoprotein-sorting protein